MPIRDIRSDLVSRLTSAERRKDVLNEQLNDIAKEVSALKQMLEIENDRLGNQQDFFSIKAHEEPAMDLPKFIRSITQRKPLTKNEMVEYATPKGYFYGKNVSPGRVVHFTVVNMVHREELKVVGEGKYLAT